MHDIKQKSIFSRGHTADIHHGVHVVKIERIVPPERARALRIAPRVNRERSHEMPVERPRFSRVHRDTYEVTIEPAGRAHATVPILLMDSSATPSDERTEEDMVQEAAEIRDEGSGEGLAPGEDVIEEAVVAAEPEEAPEEIIEFFTSHPGLEGHDFLSTRDEIVAELEEIERRDRRLALYDMLARELGRTSQGRGELEQRLFQDRSKGPQRSAAVIEEEPFAPARPVRPAKIIETSPATARTVYTRVTAATGHAVAPERSKPVASHPVKRIEGVGGSIAERPATEKVKKAHHAWLRFPHITFPRMHLPRMRFPRLRVPQLTLPRLRMPHISAPSMHLPKISAPTLRMPRVLPRLRLPKFRMPRITLPALRMPSLPRAVNRIFAVCFVILLVAGGAFWGRTHFAATEVSLRQQGAVALREMMEGFNAALQRDFTSAQANFGGAYDRLKNIGGGARIAGKSLALIADAFSFTTDTTSGVHVLDAAQYFAKAGEELSQYAALFSRNGIGSLTPREFITGYLSSTDLHTAKKLMADAIIHLNLAMTELEHVDAMALPEEYRGNIETLRKNIPAALAAAKEFSTFQDALFDVFGYLGPRKYLIVFQNNAELRPTGGFIGSYAILDALDGKVTKLFIDDVFNIDGQLVDRVIPPFPVQKISTAWSLHDANWFFDYPTSAKKIAWFYEKTGGATVDGVIAITPKVLERFLELTGDLDLPSYGIRLTRDNFRDELSWLIDQGTPKQEGVSPKVVLRDLGTLMFERLQTAAQEKLVPMLDILADSLDTRDLMFWVRNAAVEEFLARRAWDGGMRVSDGDYLAVVHANINGFKTDRVIHDEISHAAKIADDGSVLDTVTVTRRHFGSPLERYNALYQKVNADYLRVYVPKGSQLVEAQGQTLEDYVAPINYKDAYFSADAQVQDMESSMRTHYPSGTQVYEESGKTVFGNWVYVSPGESVSVTYTYRLPWRVSVAQGGSYTMLVQKQAGSEHASFSGAVAFGEDLLSNVPSDVSFEKDIEYTIAVR